MHLGKPLVLCYCNSMFLILLLIQLSSSLGSFLLHNWGIVPQIVKYWLLLRAFVIGMGTLQLVYFIFILTINHLSFF